MKFTGILNIPEGNDLNTIRYVLYNKDINASFNITEKLKEVYNKQNKKCGLVINYKGKDIFNEVGELYRDYSNWMINGVSIDWNLWDLTGKLVHIDFHDMLALEREEVL